MNSIKKFLTYALLLCMVTPIIDARGGGGHGGGGHGGGGRGGGMRGGGMHGGMRGGMRGGGRIGGHGGRGPQRAGGPGRGGIGRGGRGPGRGGIGRGGRRGPGRDGRGGRGGRGWNRGGWNRGGWYENGYGWGLGLAALGAIPLWAGYYGYPWGGYSDDYPSNTVYVEQPVTTNVSTSVSSEDLDDQQLNYWIVINNTPESLLLTNESGDTITLESGSQTQLSHTDGFNLHISSIDGQRQTEISSSNHTLNLHIDPHSNNLVW